MNNLVPAAAPAPAPVSALVSAAAEKKNVTATRTICRPVRTTALVFVAIIIVVT